MGLEQCDIGAGCGQASAQTAAGAPVRSVTVSAVGTADVEPDEATVRLTFRQRAPELAAAHTAVQRDVQRFMDAFVAAGFTADQARQGSLNYHPNYSYHHGDGPRFVDFSAEVVVLVKVTDINTVPRVLDLGIRSGVEQLSPVEFRVADQEAVRTRAREQAMRTARQRAESLARGFDARLAEVLVIEEDPARASSPFPVMRAEMAMAADSGGFADIAPNALTVQVEVRVTYGLR